MAILAASHLNNSFTDPLNAIAQYRATANFFDTHIRARLSVLALAILTLGESTKNFLYATAQLTGLLLNRVTFECMCNSASYDKMVSCLRKSLMCTAAWVLDIPRIFVHPETATARYIDRGLHVRPVALPQTWKEYLSRHRNKLIGVAVGLIALPIVYHLTKSGALPPPEPQVNNDPDIEIVVTNPPDTPIEPTPRTATPPDQTENVMTKAIKSINGFVTSAILKLDKFSEPSIISQSKTIVSLPLTAYILYPAFFGKDKVAPEAEKAKQQVHSKQQTWKGWYMFSDDPTGPLMPTSNSSIDKQYKVYQQKLIELGKKAEEIQQKAEANELGKKAEEIQQEAEVNELGKKAEEIQQKAEVAAMDQKPIDVDRGAGLQLILDELNNWS